MLIQIPYRAMEYIPSEVLSHILAFLGDNLHDVRSFSYCSKYLRDHVMRNCSLSFHLRYPLVRSCIELIESAHVYYLQAGMRHIHSIELNGTEIDAGGVDGDEEVHNLVKGLTIARSVIFSEIEHKSLSMEKMIEAIELIVDAGSQCSIESITFEACDYAAIAPSKWGSLRALHSGRITFSNILPLLDMGDSFRWYDGVVTIVNCHIRGLSVLDSVVSLTLIDCHGVDNKDLACIGSLRQLQSLSLKACSRISGM